jgi:hypothetical protein
MQLIVLNEDGINSLLCDNGPVDGLLFQSMRLQIPLLDRLELLQHLLAPRLGVGLLLEQLILFSRSSFWCCII